MSLAVVLSDVDIGDNSNTCWYQQKYHEKYLQAALAWVANPNNHVVHLVLLGDLVDFWTYPADKTPPTLTQIINKNQAILGKGGALDAAAKTVTANKGRVWLTPGNHDITLTLADAQTLSASIGTQIMWEQQQSIRLTGVNSGKAMFFVHGHYFTMFNAPDLTTNLHPMQVGHFGTGIIAWYMNKTMPSTKNVSDYPLWGQPPLSADAIADALNKGQTNIAQVLIQAIQNVTGIPDGTNVVVPRPGGKTASITSGQVKAHYPNPVPTRLGPPNYWPPRSRSRLEGQVQMRTRRTRSSRVEGYEILRAAEDEMSGGEAVYGVLAA